MPSKSARANDRLDAYYAQRHIITDEEMMDMWRDDISGLAVMTQAESVRLCALAQAGDTDARNAVVEGNIRLVPWVASRYKLTGRGVPMSDLVQEGSLGLLDAVMLYRPGHAFATYATKVIWSRMRRLVDQDALTIHIPEGVLIRVAAERAGRPITSSMAPLSKQQRVAEARARRLRSLDASLAPDEPDSAPLGESISDPDADTEADAMRHAEKSELRRLLESLLPPREMLIIALMFGLDGSGESRSLSQVGRQLGITRERVRQIKDRAIDRLRHRLALGDDGSVVLRRVLVELASHTAA